VKATIGTILPTDGKFCKVERIAKFKVNDRVNPIPLKPINNLITSNGDGRNDVLDFDDQRLVTNLEIYNRWGKKVFSASEYKNDWKPGPDECGTYFVTAEVSELGIAQKSVRYTSWVEVVTE
jgi:hypothetical protein